MEQREHDRIADRKATADLPLTWDDIKDMLVTQRVRPSSNYRFSHSLNRVVKITIKELQFLITLMSFSRDLNKFNWLWWEPSTWIVFDSLSEGRWSKKRCEWPVQLIFHVEKLYEILHMTVRFRNLVTFELIIQTDFQVSVSIRFLMIIKDSTFLEHYSFGTHQFHFLEVWLDFGTCGRLMNVSLSRFVEQDFWYQKGGWCWWYIKLSIWIPIFGDILTSLMQLDLR